MGSETVSGSLWKEGLDMLADYHVHCEFSDDSVYPMEDVCADAVKLGIKELCFTDHVDYGIKPDVEEYRRDPSCAPVVNGVAITNVDYPAYFAKIDEMSEKFAGQLTVRAGLELGTQSHRIEQNHALFKAWEHKLDFVICSIHEVGDLEFWTGDFQRGRTQDEYNRAYYEELLKVVETFEDYSVLGHLDLIRRYDPAGEYPFEKTRDIVAAILERVIADGKGIELNTSSFRYGLPDLQPSTDVLRLYHDLGGRVLTVGSDSHKPEHLGAHIEECRGRLRDLGFTEFCTFEKMHPTFLPL